MSQEKWGRVAYENADDGKLFAAFFDDDGNFVKRIQMVWDADQHCWVVPVENPGTSPTV